MRIKRFLTLLIFSLGCSVFVNAAPQDLDAFFDFENVTGEGAEFIIGESPNSIRVIGFTLEAVVNPALAHSGTRTLTLKFGQEGKILFERGVNLLQFYAGDVGGGGRIELRDKNFAVLAQQGTVVGLPTNISPGANPPLQSFVAFSGDVADTTDLNFTNGIKELKIINVTGVVALDDLGFSYIEGPPDNTVYDDFEGLQSSSPVFANRANFTLGVSPVSATFTGGLVQSASGLTRYNHTFPSLFFAGGTSAGQDASAIWAVENELTGTITFETPAAQVQFYAVADIEGDALIEVFDTNDTLLTSTSDVPDNISIEFDVPFTFFDFNAEALGAPGGIGKITYSNSSAVSSISGSFTHIAIDDIGFTPIGAPSGGGPSAPSITTQPANQEVQSGTAVVLSVAASGADLTYQWYTGNSGDTAAPVAGATGSTLDTGVLTVSTNFWVEVANAGGSANSDTAVITVAAPSIPLVLEGMGDIAGENIQHPNGNIFDQILLTGESIRLQARPNQITRVSFMDENEDIVQVEFSGAGTFTVTLDPATFLPPALPPALQPGSRVRHRKTQRGHRRSRFQYLLQYLHRRINQRGESGVVPRGTGL